ncbi:hypothetical protein LA080_006733 [Diaporthe eres]|uniref:F-box domain-containing protein n=1 Tax=Diaporthe vaccinii TaxID=105482 RepID=A0ABR4ELC8_9PEZI|nr:hypothetical protein LA080_006733 [Diaporthe eres]
MAQDSDSHQPVPAHGSHLPWEGMAGLLGMPQELLRMVAADPVLTNRDRKLARLACRVLDGAMTPVVFRRAFISRLRADRDSFLSIAATPHLAACVEEVVWLELGSDGLALENLPSDLEGYQDLRAHLLETAGGLCWLPKSGKSEAKEFSGQFNAAIACMPKVRGFSSEPMRCDRLLCSHADNYPVDVGLLTTHGSRDRCAWTQGLVRFLLPTMRKQPGKITRLRCSAGLFKTEFGPSLVRSHIPSTFKHLTCINFSYSWEEWRNWIHWRYAIGDGRAFLRSLQSALFAATDLQELRLAFDCGLEGYGPAFRLPDWMFRDEDGQPHKWKRLRSLRFAYLMRTEAWLTPLIAAHADTLRHLDLDHCNLYTSFALQVAYTGSKGKALQLHSITINEPGVHESALISEKTLLGFVRHGISDLAREWAGKYGKDLSSDAGETGGDPAPDHEHDTGDNEDFQSEDSDYNPGFEFTAEAEEDYNSDEESPPLFRHMKWDEWGEAEQIGRGPFVNA